MTTKTTTQKRVVELIDAARAATTEQERNARCWEIALAMQPKIRGQIRRATKASEESSRRWNDLSWEDMEQGVAIRVLGAAQRLVTGKADDSRPVAYLQGAVKHGIADAQRTTTKDVMPQSTRRWREAHGLDAPPDAQRVRYNQNLWMHHLSVGVAYLPC